MWTRMITLLPCSACVVKDIEIKALLKNSLIDKINDRTLFMQGIDVSYYYEGYSTFTTGEL